MIAVVAETYQDAWNYLEPGLPEPIFTVVRDEAEAADVLPDAVVFVSGDRELYETLVRRMEESLAVGVQVPLHLS